MKRLASRLQLLVMLLTLFATCSFANEGLDIHPTILIMNHKDRQEEIFVQNKGNQTAYIKVDTYQYLHIGQPNQTTQRVTNPRQANLVVTPHRLVIKPGQQRVVRIRILRPVVDHDQIYSIHINEASAKPKPPLQTVPTADGSVNLLIGFDVLLIHHRIHGKVNISAIRKGYWVTFKNTGNTTGRVRGYRLCQHDVCKPSVEAIIMPGQTIRAKLPFAIPARFIVYNMHKHHTIESN